jgi:hypothetical protein
MNHTLDLTKAKDADVREMIAACASSDPIGAARDLSDLLEELYDLQGKTPLLAKFLERALTLTMSEADSEVAYASESERTMLETDAQLEAYTKWLSQADEVSDEQISRFGASYEAEGNSLIGLEADRCERRSAVEVLRHALAAQIEVAIEDAQRVKLQPVA